MKFIIDNMLGKSAKYLRMLGHDTLYPPPNDQQELISKAVQENRYIITRSSKLYQKASSQTKILSLSSNNFTTRFQKIIEKFNLQIEDDKIFSRCLQCNSPLQNIKKSKIEDRLPQKVKSYFDNFSWCPTCDKIYWKGGHTERMLNKVKSIIKQD